MAREIIEVEDAAALAKRAAAWLFERAKASQGRFSVCLSGGSTPKRLYGLLTQEPYRDAFPWDRVHWFWGDERLVPPTDPLSNERMAHEALLDHAPIPPANIHPILTDKPSLEACASAYQDELETYYGSDGLDPARPLFDVVLLGIGQDGHTASLFPHSPALAEFDRWVAPVAVAGQDPRVPRITLTFPALASSAAAAFLVSGADKRDRLAEIFAGADLPAAKVTSAGPVIWFADRPALGHSVASL